MNKNQLFEYCRIGNDEKLVAEIGSYEESYQYRDKDGQTLLHIACNYGKLNCVIALVPVDHLIDLNATSKTGATPIIMAAVKGHTEVVRHLLNDSRVNPNIVGLRGRGALHGSCLHGHLSSVLLLLQDERVDVNQVDHEGRTPLLDAAKKGYKRIVETILLSSRLDKDAIPAAYYAAVTANQAEIVSLLQFYV